MNLKRRRANPVTGVNGSVSIPRCRPVEHEPCRPSLVSVMLINCRSVKNKTDELTGLVSSFGPDIVIGSESWLDESISSSEVFPAEYVAYRKDRNTHGGGVFVLVKHTLPSFAVDFEANSCESVWCKVVLEHSKQLTVGAFYRPPNDNSSHTFNTLSQLLLTVSTDYFLVGGDFNMPDAQ